MTQGVVGIYTAPDGHVVATAACFKPDTPGGFTRAEAQEYRARQSLYRAVIDAYCSRVVYDALDAYLCEQIVRKLPGKMTFIRIGHDDA